MRLERADAALRSEPANVSRRENYILMSEAARIWARHYHGTVKESACYQRIRTMVNKGKISFRRKSRRKTEIKKEAFNEVMDNRD